MLFWGAIHVDGRGFDTEINRPTNLQNLVDEEAVSKWLLSATFEQGGTSFLLFIFIQSTRKSYFENLLH